MNSKTILGAVILATTVGLSITAAPRAEACGGAVWRDTVQRKAKPAPAVLVAKAEKEFDEGKRDAALKVALEAFPRLEKGEGATPVEARALRLAALATIRSGGNESVVGAKAPVSYMDYDYGKEVNIPARLTAAKSDDDRQARMAWAVKTLRTLHEKNATNVTYEGDLGEALAAMPGNEDEAFGILNKLAEKELLGSPEAYAALSRMRFQQGLVKASIEALQRCRMMSTTPASCGPDVSGTAS
jgi:hypothetical protein